MSKKTEKLVNSTATAASPPDKGDLGGWVLKLTTDFSIKVLLILGVQYQSPSYNRDLGFSIKVPLIRGFRGFWILSQIYVRINFDTPLQDYLALLRWCIE